MRKTYDPDALSEQGDLSVSRQSSETAEMTSCTRPNEMTRVDAPPVPTLLVEPNTLLREGLKRILSETPYSLCASGANLDEVWRAWPPNADPFLLIIDAVSDHETKCE